MRPGSVVGVLMMMCGVAFGGPDQLEPDRLAGPAPEVNAAQVSLPLPALPSFELSPPEPGFVHPQYLQLRGRTLLDTKVKVKGYITWIYDCIKDVKRPKEARNRTQRRIDADPTLCERPKFYLATTRDTPHERALWVVDVPRPPNKLEKERLPKEELRAWPKVPKYKLGDYVVVTGTFALQSPHSERNSDGLLVFEAIEPAKRPKHVAKPAAPAPSVAVSLPARAKSVPAVPLRKVVAKKVRDESFAHLATGNRALGQRQFEQAIAGYRRAAAAWPDNHLAWYGLGGAAAFQGDWKAALAAFEKTAKLRPDQPMYQLWAGVASYEAAVAAARAAQAAKAGAEPHEIRPDLFGVAFDTARAYLEQAIALEPALWRAHYFLGRIARESRVDKLAAESFTRAILADRKQQGPYIALAELYRKWGYTQEATAVATLGTQHLDPSPQVSDVFYVLAMAYDDQGADTKAVDAFTRALEYKPDNAKALFQRGQCYFRLGKLVDAKRDLEAFLAADAPALAFARAQAKQLLDKITARKL